MGFRTKKSDRYPYIPVQQIFYQNQEIIEKLCFKRNLDNSILKNWKGKARLTKYLVEKSLKGLYNHNLYFYYSAVSNLYLPCKTLLLILHQQNYYLDLSEGLGLSLGEVYSWSLLTAPQRCDGLNSAFKED